MGKEDRERITSRNEDDTAELGISEILKRYEPPASLDCHHATAEMINKRNQIKHRDPNATDYLKCPIRLALATIKPFMQKKDAWPEGFHLFPKKALEFRLPCEDCPTHAIAARKTTERIRKTGIEKTLSVEQIEFLVSLDPSEHIRVNDPALSRNENKHRKFLAKTLEEKKLIVLHKPMLEEPNNPSAIHPTLTAIPSWTSTIITPWSENSSKAEKAGERDLITVPRFLLNQYAINLDNDIQKTTGAGKTVTTEAGKDFKHYFNWFFHAYRQSRAIAKFTETASAEDYITLGLLDYACVLNQDNINTP